MTQTVLILGGTSDMARAIARGFAAEHAALILSARDTATLAADLTDLQHRGAASARAVTLDILAPETFAPFVESLGTLPDIVVCAIGLLGEQSLAEKDTALARRILDTNFSGPALLLGEFAHRMEARGSGVIVGISSVAGDRGRASNYVYGAAKAGFSAFLSGLRNRLAKKNVHVLTVKPGFVATRMTENMQLPAALTAQPEDVAHAVLQAITRRRNVVYVYPIWRVIMFIIAHIPEFIFKKLSL